MCNVADKVEGAWEGWLCGECPMHPPIPVGGM